MNNFTFDVTITTPQGSITRITIPCVSPGFPPTIDVDIGDVITVLANPPTHDLYTFLWDASNGTTKLCSTMFPRYDNPLTFTISKSSDNMCLPPIQLTVQITDIDSVILYCGLIFGTKTLPITVASIDVSVDGNTGLYSTCCGSICVKQNANVILTANTGLLNPTYQWYICNSPIVGQTDKIYQPDTSMIGSISYTIMIEPTSSQNSSDVFFCNITINTLPPINIQIGAIVNCSPKKILTCGLEVCQGDVVSLSVILHSTITHDVIPHSTITHDVIPHSTITHDVILHSTITHDVIPHSTITHDVIVGYAANYIYQWILNGELIATTESIIVCTDVPNVYSYTVQQTYCCNIQIYSICVITLTVLPKVSIVPIRNDVIIPYSKNITAKQCDILYLFADSNNRIVWKRNGKNISSSQLINVKTKHRGKSIYSVEIIKNEKELCSACSMIVDIVK